MPCACDFKCAAAAGCFFASNVLFFIYRRLRWAVNDSVAATQRNSYFNVESWKDLDPAYIQNRWIVQDNLRALHMTAALFGAVAWFWLMVPIIQSAWVLSRGGKRKVGTHALLAALAVCGGIMELLARLITVGMTNASLWLARDFNLSDWEYNGDDAGWRVLEMIHMVTRSMTLWVDAFEGLALLGIFVLFHYSVATEPAFKVMRIPESESKEGSSAASDSIAETAKMNYGAASPSPKQSASEPGTTRVSIEPTFSKRFTYFGLFVGLLSLVHFLVDVLRFVNWRLFGRVAMWTNVLLGLVFLPVWLLWLGSQLPEATGRFESEERRDGIHLHGKEIEMAVLKDDEVEIL